METTVAAGRVADDRRGPEDGGMLASEAEDLDLGGRLGLPVKIERGRLVGGLVVAGDPVEDGVRRKVDQLGSDMETKLGEFPRDLRVQRAGLGGVGQTGLDCRQGGAMHDRLGELLE